MLTCKFASLLPVSIFTLLVLIYNSDGDTPEKQTEQILAVTTILRGQKSSERNVIPPHQSQPQSEPQTYHEQPSKSEGNQSDLIDFGQNDSSQHPSISESDPHPLSDLRPSQTKNGGQSHNDVEQMLASTSTDQARHGSLLDFQDDLKKGLPALHRKDTDTRSIDEFVDAQE